MKKCSKCKKLKEDNCFSPDKRTLTGLQSQCRECQREYNRKHYRKYREYHKKYQRKYDKEKCSKYGIGLGTLRRYGLKIGLAVYDKFERKCIKCGGINNLTIHHLDGNGRNNENKKLPVNNNLDNLILICRKCHGSIHGKQGGRPKKIQNERK